MTIAHLSDTHLGFSAYSRLHPSGINGRQFDVQMTFKRVLDSILGRAPDLVLHSGDLFHVVRPSNATIDQTHLALSEFQRARNWAPFVLVAGNHDSPKTADAGNIQRHIARIPGIRFAASMAEVIDIPELDCEVLCVPSNSLVAREEVVYRPTLGRKYSILSVHGMATQALPKAVDLVHADFDVNDLHHEKFSYVALGDYHVFSEYAPNCCFAGSTDYTTTNIWEEVGKPKGWVWFDTSVGQLQHVAVPTRPAIDLPIIDATDISIEEIQDLMRTQAALLEGEPMVRQRISGIHNADRRRLFQTSLIREINAKCLNYQVACSAPTRDKGTGAVTGSASASTSLEALWLDHAAEASIPSNVGREAFSAAGLELLKGVEAA